ncbi:hypothetical protein BUALT_Bualt02G0243800 [Buddleja alternifolia]|uniref:BHLH transcription factor n=1 Tax=Buddleja alternifolia TaxID=168488 RepID=A0AAV6Y432_9LAMI|nr:hypothetical protein BUALT_Bualt02G0243800 [Buddleja alternifolia]
MSTGKSQQLLLSFLVKEKCDFSNPLWINCISQMRLKNRRCRRIAMKRRRSIIRPRNAIGNKVRTLKKLVPNCESMGVEGLFRETADYIVALQMRVKLMQDMVNLLSASGDE